MGIFDFLKKITKERESEGVKAEKIAFSEARSWIENKKKEIEAGEFTIVRRSTAPSCIAVTQCAGYATNPNIMCLNSKCVLGNVASMTAGVSVTNPSTSQIAFLNVAPKSATPLAFNTALDKTPVSRLAPGQIAAWASTAMPVDIWEGTQQTFNVTVSGTNEYNGAIVKASDAIILVFDADLAGTFTVSIQSPI